MKRFIKVISLFIILAATIFGAVIFPNTLTQDNVYALSSSHSAVLARNESYNKWNEYVYEEYPTMKIEKYFDDYPEIIDAVVKHYEQLLKRIPQHIRQRLKARNVTVHYVENCRDYWGKNPPKFVLGLFNPANNRIYISLSSDSVEDALNGMERVTYHELGHAVAEVFGDLDKTREWKDIYQKTLESRPIMMPQSCAELFADTFYFYVCGLGDDGTCNGGDIGQRATVQKDYPLCAEYLCKKLNLPQLCEGYFFYQIRYTRYAVLKEYRHVQTIERVRRGSVENVISMWSTVDIIHESSQIQKKQFILSNIINNQ